MNPERVRFIKRSAMALTFAAGLMVPGVARAESYDSPYDDGYIVEAPSLTSELREEGAELKQETIRVGRYVQQNWRRGVRGTFRIIGEAVESAAEGVEQGLHTPTP
jgi:hypothetical protein